MKKIFTSILLTACGLMLAVGCIEEATPSAMTDSDGNVYVSVDQAMEAPGSFDNFVDAITNSLCGSFLFGGNDNTYPWDYGYPSFYLVRDVMGQDIVVTSSGSEWYTAWYTSSTALQPTNGYTQMPWYYYSSWIKGCNVVIGAAGSDPKPEQLVGLGIAHTMRAMFYMDLARMYAPKSYLQDKDALTVPIVDENTTSEQATNNPRATNEKMWAFILSDLDKAEVELKDYVRPDVYTPDSTVVKGLKARAYLEIGDYPKAEQYAKDAQTGYSLLTEAQYLDQKNGFNKPNAAWMFGLTFKSDDKNIELNDADSCWGSQMIIEVSASQCGYSSNYVGPKRIDAHLFSTIPATDFRRKCFIDPALDALSKSDALAALATYTDDPAGVYNTCVNVDAAGVLGCAELKFRPKDGVHDDQYKAFTVAVPIMRVEEMYLIEAEAAGMQDVTRGENLLTAFAKTRDASYVYGNHNEQYGNGANSAFQNEIWWQRRVELWGEGFATFDIKRFGKGIIRSYAGTNHLESYCWNTDGTPDWMTFCFHISEANYNRGLENNPIPIAPESDSAEYVF